MVYMGVLTGRVPILPPFTPMHVGADAGSIAFGEVFDLPRWSRDIGIPLVDWYEVKDNSTDIVEGLGGWSVWQTVDGAPRWSVATHILNLDVSYTRVPDNVAVGLNNHAYFWALARLGFQGDRQRAMEQAQPRAGPRTGIVLEPDDHVLMFDFLYFVCVQEVFEFEKEYSPAWRHVLTHAHFTPRIEALATGAMRTLLDVPTGAPIPPFIAMHIRHGDFGNYCGEHNRGNCFASLDTWAEYVREVRDELLERKGVDAATVLVTSDESNEGWWDEVASLGWTRVDHNVLGTVSKYGKWYPVFIDAVIQASGEGFVGTAGSTMSLLAMRRTQDWRGGIGRLVQWNEIR